jgi:thermosome
MDKMLVDSNGDIVISNDGATLIEEIDIEHPSAKMIVEVAKSQDEECGDGTTSAVILAGELLKSARQLLDKKIHPTVVTSGYKLAADKAIEVLKSNAISIKSEDKDTLKKIAMTAMASKGASESRDFLADLVVDGMTSIIEQVDGKNVVDLNNIQIKKQQGGTTEDTKIIKGVILTKSRVHEKMPKYVKNAKIALINLALEVKKTEVDSKIQIHDPAQLKGFLNEEDSMLRMMVEKIKKSDAKVLICQKGIDDLAKHLLSKNGIYTVQRVKKEDMERLAKATGGKIVANLDDLNSNDLGYALNVEERKYGNNKLTFITDCENPKAVSILLRGGTEHVVDELERSLYDSLSVVKVALKDKKITVGGGAAATEIAMALRDYAPSVGGREQMAIEAFADAMEVIPKTLSKNAGLDPIDMMLDLRSAHKKGKKYDGINVFTGKVEDMVKNNIIEPLRVGIQEIQAASEASTMILRIDDVIASKKEEKSPSAQPAGAGGLSPGSMSGMGY